jgi:hypothetical protein
MTRHQGRPCEDATHVGGPASGGWIYADLRCRRHHWTREIRSTARGRITFAHLELTIVRTARAMLIAARLSRIQVQRPEAVESPQSSRSELDSRNPNPGDHPGNPAHSGLGKGVTLQKGLARSLTNDIAGSRTGRHQISPVRNHSICRPDGVFQVRFPCRPRTNGLRALNSMTAYDNYPTCSENSLIPSLRISSSP